MNTITELRKIVDEMENGSITVPSEVILLHRDMASGIITIFRAGEPTGLLKEVWELMRPNA